MQDIEIINTDLRIYQGANFFQDFTAKIPVSGLPFDLTNYVAFAQVRKTITSTSSVAFDVEITDAINGKVRILLKSTDTSQLNFGYYVYDVILMNVTGQHPEEEIKVNRLAQGQVYVDPAVTRI